MVGPPSTLAIIGGGAAGLISAHVARKFGQFHSIRVFEKRDITGGLWRNACEGKQYHPPMYRDLRTNLPTRLMEIPGFEFHSAGPSSFVHRSAVTTYLDEFAKHVDVDIGFKKQVNVISPSTAGHGFSVQWLDLEANDAHQQDFDAVLVCAGHFTQPNIPDAFRSQPYTIHSSEFDTPEEFADERVVVIGAGSSARDIVTFLATGGSREVVWAGEKVRSKYLSRSLTESTLKEKLPNLTVHSGDLEQFLNSTGPSPQHVIICATGYRYEFDFLHDALRPKVFQGRHLQTLKRGYSLSPGIGFIGFAPAAVPLGVMYYQAKDFILSHGVCNEAIDTSACFQDEMGFRDMWFNTTDRTDIDMRAELFDFCEEKILDDFTTYRDWHYEVCSNGEWAAKHVGELARK